MSARESEWFAQHLPPIKERELRGPADYYGASSLIAAGMRLSSPPSSCGYWAHGWHYAPYNAKLLSDGCDRDTRMLVATERDAEILRDDGFQDVSAVGLPFVYTRSPKVKRRPNSLLIMPPHVTIHQERNWNEHEYIDVCVELAKQFETVVACVSQNCVAKGYWVRSFDAANIPWIAGAGAADANALVRIRCLMSQFECMTTPSIGSHVVYATYCGCRVSLYGPAMVGTAEYLKHELLYVQHPDLIDVHISRDSEESLRSYYGHLFSHPIDSVCDINWAKSEIGEQHRLPFHLMAEQLGWGKRYKLWIKECLKTLGVRKDP